MITYYLLFIVGAITNARICTRVYQPVCGVDGKMYSNECALNCKSVAKKHDGECPKTDCPYLRNLRNVCGIDGLTYANSCLMRCNGASEADRDNV